MSAVEGALVGTDVHRTPCSSLGQEDGQCLPKQRVFEDWGQL